MEQLEFFKIPSPCICVCEMNNRGYCKGCFRSREERLYWLKLTNPQKRDVLRLCLQRRRKAQWPTQHNDDLSGPDEPELDFGINQG